MSNVGKWGFSVPPSVANQSTPLGAAIAQLNSKAKQAMFAAASHRTIRRGTWNGCAFNAAGAEEGSSEVISVARAAEAFGCSPKTVKRFIHAWDATSGDMTDQEATNYLKTLLSQDLFSDPEEYKKHQKEIGSFVVYESLETRMKKFEEQFETDTVPLTDEALELLCV